MEKLLLKPKEAAEAIGVGRTKLYQLVKANQIPSCRVGNSIRIPVAGLHALIEKQLAPLPDALPVHKSSRP